MKQILGEGKKKSFAKRLKFRENKDRKVYRFALRGELLERERERERDKKQSTKSMTEKA